MDITKELLLQRQEQYHADLLQAAYNAGMKEGAWFLATELLAILGTPEPEKGSESNGGSSN